MPFFAAIAAAASCAALRFLPMKILTICAKGVKARKSCEDLPEDVRLQRSFQWQCASMAGHSRRHTDTCGMATTAIGLAPRAAGTWPRPQHVRGREKRLGAGRDGRGEAAERRAMESEKRR